MWSSKCIFEYQVINAFPDAKCHIDLGICCQTSLLSPTYMYKDYDLYIRLLIIFSWPNNMLWCIYSENQSFSHLKKVPSNLHSGEKTWKYPWVEHCPASKLLVLFLSCCWMENRKYIYFYLIKLSKICFTKCLSIVWLYFKHRPAN